MNSTITITLKTSLLNQLEAKTKNPETNINALINKALEDYFYFDRLNQLRHELKEQAQQQGFDSEEAIFAGVS